MNERNRRSNVATDTHAANDGSDGSTERVTTGNQKTGAGSTTDMAAAMARRNEPGAEVAPSRGGTDDRTTPLFAGNESEGFRSRWSEVQTGFVDEPRQSVEKADGLVAEVVQRLVQTFADERNRLEAQWDKGDDVSTEDLRIALQRYRSFFERLLAA
jgi:hypothetical protein